MSNKATSIYFLIFAIAYVLYVTLFITHGIDFTNSGITIGSLIVSGYYYLRHRKEQ